MNNGEPLSGDWLTAWEHAMLIEEAKEQEQSDSFYSSIPELRKKVWPPDDEWVPFSLPWVEGRCIPEKRMSLKDGKWVFESRYPKPSEETDDD